MKPRDVYSTVRQLISSLDIHELPIDPFLIADELKICVLTFAQAQQLLGLDFAFRIDYLIGMYKLEAFSYKNNGRYLICYDETISPTARINFTIAHEIGHIQLNHLVNNGMLPRYMFTTVKDPIEKEADIFAGELLRPPALLALAHCDNVDDIEDVCGITYGASIVGSKLVSKLETKLSNSNYSSVFSFYAKQFHDFIYTHYCPTCHSTFIGKDTHYCPICGSKDIWWFNKNLRMLSFFENNQGELDVMRYRQYDTDENNRVTQCLQCENEDIREEHKFCMICGLELENSCFGKPHYDGYGNIEWIEEQDGCHKPLPPNARYCPYCGAMSVYFYKHILKDWQKEQAEIEQEQEQEFQSLQNFDSPPDEEINF
ncbi:ImmA/IrrE family metallo-endopeptidase [Pectinatus frisingensis]|uniref:ImmA/IrrE family metallo-endopeptidase n=1 Tax=Pectinatus frisingensis TaxID=865 RepID=UPI0018C775A4|nr:ImmA/IrrE family metallo-endopeptidase [Pectinatus frisingensis]